MARPSSRGAQAGPRQPRSNDRRTALPLPRDAQASLERRGLSVAEEALQTAGRPEPGGDHYLLRVDPQSEAAHDPDERVRRRPARVASRAPEGHRYRQPTHAHPWQPGPEPEGA